MSQQQPPDEGAARGEAVLAIFQRGAEFTQELLEENARLRKELERVHHRHQGAAQSDPEWGKLREELLSKIDELENQNQSFRQEIQSVEEENHEFAERYVSVEEENNSLANLYVASYQLHSTLDPVEVVKTILEIVINLVGAEVFAVYVTDGESDLLKAVASEGEAVSTFPDVRVGPGLVGESLAEAEVKILDWARDGSEPERGGAPIVSIPLVLDQKPVGAIVIYSLLEQKDGFTSLDHELFRLLAGHAATAIFASRLYSRSERKLSTIQGFIDLLTN